MPTVDENLDRLERREAAQALPVRVQVVKFDIPFFQLVWLLLKIAIAAIPAAILFFVLVAFVTGVIATFMGVAFTGLFNGWRWI